MFPRKPKPHILGKYGDAVQIGYMNEPVHIADVCGGDASCVTLFRYDEETRMQGGFCRTRGLRRGMRFRHVEPNSVSGRLYPLFF